jgi:ABC-type cobalt transport system substrate-binding protein
MYRRILIGLVVAGMFVFSAAAANASWGGDEAEKAPVEIGGVVQAWFDAVEDAETFGGEYQEASTTFAIRHARVYWKGDLSDEISYKILYELGTETHDWPWFDITGDENDGDLYDAWVKVAPKDWDHFYIQAGQIKYPFGYNRMFGVGKLDFVDYFFINGAIPGEAWQPGVAMGYETPDVAAKVMLFNGEGDNSPEFSNNFKDLAFSIQGTPFTNKDVLVGGSVMSARSTLSEEDVWFDVFANVRFANDWVFTGEYVHVDDMDVDTWVAELLYEYSEDWDFLAAYEDLEDLSADWAFWFGVNYYLLPEVRLSANYRRMDYGDDEDEMNRFTAQLQAIF